MPILSPDQLTGLTDATSLRHLFTYLGYDSIEQITYSPRTLDWPDNVAVNLRGREFELLAEADDGFFQVLLLEPHPETNGLSADLVRRLYGDLEKRGNEAILVLPGYGWGTFELVLLADLRPLDQRGKPPTSFLRFSFDPCAVQPHQQRALELLDVTNAGPGEATELAARAFRRAQQERFFRSLNFFSTYYLERRIATDATTRAEWAALLPQMAGLRAALVGADTNATLVALGWQMMPATRPGATAHLRAGGGDAALISIVPAGHALDQALPDGSYPQLDLIAALEHEKQFDGLKWGVLTDGRTWRLYSRIAASISGAFYEVDLADLLEFGAEEDVRYFAGFFGAAGLVTGFAEKVFYSSQMLAKEVGEDLKKIVFEQVFARLANGIADDLKRWGKYDGSEAQHQLIFRATLVLLYRVLFLLYAESMRLLPTIYPPYYAGSLTRLLTEIALQPFTEAHLRKPMHPDAFWAWEWLQELFTTVSAGSTERGVPKYNGGLFSDGAPINGVENPHKAPHRELVSVQIGAMDLCVALDLLGRDKTARGANNQDEARRLIDYAALDVRRLGSIYEGLLEYQLVEKAGGTLELKHTRQERKASGSYYTPDYIVTYIVEQAVGPVLAERERRFDALMPEVLAARKALERTERQLADERISSDTAQANFNAAEKRLELLKHEANETLLDLKILDPAMGSGHFLVAAVDFVADRLIAILQKHKEGNPILERLDGIRAQIRASLREQGVDELITDEQLNNVNLLRRMVMKRCVYGVDLNDMAVELARLSLWLNSFTIGAPLSFLDHHLKWGNSLIGARVQAVQQAMEGGKQVGQSDEGGLFQGELFSQGSAFAEMLNLARFIEELVEIADANASQVEQSAVLYADYEQHVVPVKRLLDLWVSQSFGNKEATQLIKLYSGSRQEVADLIDALMGRRILDATSQRPVEHARTLFTQHRFLHWDLDFPEVFIDLKQRIWKSTEEAGFDAVVGNPPWLESLTFDNLTKAYQRKNYFTAKEKYDQYGLFVELGIDLLSCDGFFSMIVQNKFMVTDYGYYLRSYIVENSFVRLVIDFNGSEVFQGISTYPLIILLTKEEVKETSIYKFTSPLSSTLVEQLFVSSNIRSLLHIIPSNNFTADVWRISGASEQSLWKRIEEATSVDLLQAHIISFSKGAVTCLNDAYIFSSQSCPNIEEELIQPKATARDISRYHINDSGEVVVFPYTGNDVDWTPVNIDQYPKAKEYFEGIRDSLSGRRFFGKNIIEMGMEFYEIPHISTRFNGDIIVFPKVCKRPEFAIVDADRFIWSQPAYTMGLKSNNNTLFILAILNSWFIARYLQDLAPDLRGEYIELKTTELQKVPIRRIAFTTPTAERTSQVDAAKALYMLDLTMQAAGGNWRAWRDHWRALWDWAGARLPHRADGSPDMAHEQSDAVHDLLAFLAEHMIELHKQKQARAADFTNWLEQETSSTIDEWSGKTMVQGFWEEPWENIERTLQKNRVKFAQVAGLRGKAGDAAMVPLVRATKGRWQQATGALAPTLAAITATDRLIDLLVCRLYGLTDEEIELVEGA